MTPATTNAEFDIKSLKSPALLFILCHIAYLAGCLAYELLKR